MKPYKSATARPKPALTQHHLDMVRFVVCGASVRAAVARFNCQAYVVWRTLHHAIDMLPKRERSAVIATMYQPNVGLAKAMRAHAPKFLRLRAEAA